MKLSFSLLQLLAVFLNLHDTAQAGYCGASVIHQLVARPYYSTANTLYLSGEVTCSYKIRPWRPLRSNEYLYIYWNKFEVKSAMPECRNEYVKVAITKSYYSIGSYCSENTFMASPFPIYSHDGYAQIDFKLDLSKGASVSFGYRIREGKQNSCGYIGRWANSGLVTSPAWPSPVSNERCIWDMYVPQNTIMRVVLMDISLETKTTSCSPSSDYIEVSGSTGKNTEILLRRTCSAQKPIILVSKHDKTTVTYHGEINRYHGRGVVVGVVKYRNYKPETTSSSSSGVAIGVVIGILSILLIAVIVGVCIKKRLWMGQRSVYNSTPLVTQPVTQPAAVTTTTTTMHSNPPGPGGPIYGGQYPYTQPHNQGHLPYSQPSAAVPPHIAPPSNDSPPDYATAVATASYPPPPPLSQPQQLAYNPYQNPSGSVDQHRSGMVYPGSYPPPNVVPYPPPASEKAPQP